MTRRLYNIAVVTSLVLFIVVMGFWVDSGFHVVAIPLTDISGDRIFVIAQRSGAIILGWMEYWQFSGDKLHARSFVRFSMNPSAIGAPTWFGFGVDSSRGDKLILVPHWFLALLTAILPVVWLIRRRRKRDLDAVPCAKCGYDLRGSLAAGNEICSECGASA